MTSKECEQQLRDLIEAWNLNEAILDERDIYAIKSLLSENMMQQDKINVLYKLLASDKQKINHWVDIVEKAEKWLKEMLTDLRNNYNKTSYEMGQIISLECAIAKIEELEGNEICQSQH